jgi:hypothetical protein
MSDIHKNTSSNSQQQDINSLPDWAKILIHQLTNNITEFKAHVTLLEGKVKDLENRLAKNR